MREPVRISEFKPRQTPQRVRIQAPIGRVREEQINLRSRLIDATNETTHQDLSYQQVTQIKPVEQPETQQLPAEPFVQVVPKKRRISFSKPQIALLTASIIVFCLGIYASVNTLLTNRQVVAQATQQKSEKPVTGDENSEDNPDETDPGPNALGNYRVDPTLPRKITISKIGVNARIKQLGTKSNNELKTPSNIYDVGWFEQSAKPGGNGAMLIDGHVHGPTKKGVFYNLPKLSPGDIISVERGDGVIFKYGVVKTQKFAKDSVDMKSAVTPVEPGNPGLNLITCTGEFDAKSNSYKDRVIVYTTQIL